MSTAAWTDKRYPAVKAYEKKGHSACLVRYRQDDGRQSIKRGFRTIADARNWLPQREEQECKGGAVKVSDGRVTVEALWPARYATKARTLTPAPLSSLESSWETHIKPRWGSIPVEKVHTGDVQVWAVGIHPAKRNVGKPASASVIRRAVGILDALLTTALRDGRLARNPAAASLLELPTKPRHGKAGKARRYLPSAEV